MYPFSIRTIKQRNLSSALFLIKDHHVTPLRGFTRTRVSIIGVIQLITVLKMASCSPSDVTEQLDRDQKPSRKMGRTESGSTLTTTEQDQLPKFSATPPEKVADELESVQTRPFKTQRSNESSGSETVELNISYTKTVKRRHVQKEEDEIRFDLSQQFSNVSVSQAKKVAAASDDPTATASLTVPSEVEETNASEDLVVEQLPSTKTSTKNDKPSKPSEPAVRGQSKKERVEYLSDEEITTKVSVEESSGPPDQVLTDTHHPMSSQYEPYRIVAGESPTSPYDHLTIIPSLKLCFDLCNGLKNSHEDLIHIYVGLKSLLDRLTDEDTSQTSNSADVTVGDVLETVNKVQGTLKMCYLCDGFYTVLLNSIFIEAVGPYFTMNVPERLLQWLLKSWVIFQLTHSKSDPFVRAFCSMCHKEKMIVKSHVYSNGVLKEVCGQSNKHVVWIALSKPPRTPTTPKLCVWHLECLKCDNDTSEIESSFVTRYRRGQYDSNSEQSEEASNLQEDAVLFHIYAFRGLQVNTDLVYHCLFCCRGYMKYLLDFFDRSMKYRLALKNNNKPSKLNPEIKREAANWVLFCTKPATKHHKFLTEFPLLCQVDLSDISPDLPGRICLIYGQITNSCREKSAGTQNHLCWAIPLVKCQESIEFLRPHFRRIVDHINVRLQHQRAEYFSSIKQEEPPGLKLVVGYLKTCI